VEEGDEIEGAAKKVDDMIEGEDETNGKTVGFQPTAIIGTCADGSTFTILKTQDPDQLNAWNGTMCSLTPIKCPKLYPGSMIHTFKYHKGEPVPPKIIPWAVLEQFIPNGADPYNDFDAVESGGHDEVSPLHFKVGCVARGEAGAFLKDDQRWLPLDYLNYYTDWSHRFTSNYFEKNNFFPLYFHNGEGTSIYNRFSKRCRDADDSDNNVNKMVDIIWKRVHPPSYYLFRDRKIAAFENKHQ
jgi:hypothetical protein